MAYIIPVSFILDRDDEWLSLKGSLAPEVQDGSTRASKTKSDKLEKFVGKLIDNDEPRRNFYLKGMPQIGLPDSFIDFQQITSIPFDHVQKHAKVIAKLNSPWREKLATHYAGYMMRIGVERIEGAARTQIIENLTAPIKLAVPPAT
jgi:hypothetical protein